MSRQRAPGDFYPTGYSAEHEVHSSMKRQVDDPSAPVCLMCDCNPCQCEKMQHGRGSDFPYEVCAPIYILVRLMHYFVGLIATPTGKESLCNFFVTSYSVAPKNCSSILCTMRSFVQLPVAACSLWRPLLLSRPFCCWLDPNSFCQPFVTFAIDHS